MVGGGGGCEGVAHALGERGTTLRTPSGSWFPKMPMRSGPFPALGEGCRSAVPQPRCAYDGGKQGAGQGAQGASRGGVVGAAREGQLQGAWRAPGGSRRAHIERWGVAAGRMESAGGQLHQVHGHGHGHEHHARHQHHGHADASTADVAEKLRSALFIPSDGTNRSFGWVPPPQVGV